MKIVIDIPDRIYKLVQNKRLNIIDCEILELALANGTPLPKGHGRLVDADKCIKQAWNDFYKHEDEWEKKDPDYVGVKRFYNQNGFECCLKTIGDSPTVIESEEEDE